MILTAVMSIDISYLIKMKKRIPLALKITYIFGLKIKIIRSILIGASCAKHDNLSRDFWQLIGTLLRMLMRPRKMSFH
jgi:hypothetical protein